MKIEIIFISGDKDFSKSDKKIIKNTILKHVQKAAKTLQVKRKTLTLTVYPWQRDKIYGYAQAKDWIRIDINSRQLTRKSTRQEILSRLIYLIYHEMHHCARGYVGYLPKNKKHILINSIISEGLADIFAEEQYPPTQQFTGYDWKEIQKWLPKLKKYGWNKETIKNPWIYGGERKPKKLGYKIGRYLIQNIKKNNFKLDAVKLVRTDAKKLLKLSGVKL